MNPSQQIDCDERSENPPKVALLVDLEDCIEAVA